MSKDEQKKLILILKQKLTQESEEAMAQDQERSREEFAAGLCKPTTPEQLTQAIKSRDLYQEVLTKAGLDPIVSEILIADGVEYFIAEEYHQKYLQKNPNGYDCHSSTGVAFPVGVVL